MESDKDKKLILLKDKEVHMSCSEAFKQYERFLYSSIKSYVGYYESDDLFQVASYGLIKAYKSYDSNKKILFTTYLSTIIVNELNMYVRKQKKHNNVSSMDGSISTDADGNELITMETISDDIDYSEVALTNIYNSELMDAIASLSEREQIIIKGMFFNDITQKQLGEKLNISQTYISRLIPKILDKLNKFYISGGKKKMAERKITREQLLEAAKLYGTDKDALLQIAGKYGLTIGTVEYYIYAWRIKKELAAPVHIEEESEYLAVHEPLSVTTEQIQPCNEVEQAPKSNEVTEIIEPVEAPKPNRILKPVLFRGRLMEYRILVNGYEIEKLSNCSSILLANCELDDFILELQELKEFRDVG
ncbi:MAG: sigma-70 family RNA polymerase sigma factor [Bacteroidota bacterium]|nr:sigma-70 family RNA polymerase sigma factor [Bacteroidota bacterium]